MHEEQTQTSQLHPNGDKIGILEALAKVSKAIGAIGKDKTNTQQSFKYRSIDAVMSGIHDALADNDIVITTFHKEICNTERIGKTGTVAFYKEKDFTFCFRYKDGSKLETTVTGSGADYGDKVDNKCLSVALKYALTTTFIIPLETDDPDGHSPEQTKAKDKAPKQPQMIRHEDKKEAMTIYATYCDKANLGIDKKEQFVAMVADRFNKKLIDELTEEEGKELVKIVKEIDEEFEKSKLQAAVAPVAPIVETPIVEAPAERDIDEIIAGPVATTPATSPMQLTDEQVAELPF